MSRAVLVLNHPAVRAKAARWVAGVSDGTRLEFKAPRRTLPQNARMWVMLTEIASQVAWHGVKLDAEDWKLIFLDALKRELRIVPNLDGTGFVNLGRSSSDLGKDEMSDLIELMFAWGAQNGVTFHDGAGTASTPGDSGMNQTPSIGDRT